MISKLSIRIITTFNLIIAILIIHPNVFAAPLSNNYHKFSSNLPPMQLSIIECSWDNTIQQTLANLLDSSVNSGSNETLDLAHLIRPQSLPVVEIVALQSPNAFAIHSKISKILISTKLLNHIHNSTELAFVLAHELAHLNLHHTPNVPSNILLTKQQLKHIHKTRCHWEQSADIKAFNMLTKAGYDPIQGIKLLERLSRTENIESKTFSLKSHAPANMRISLYQSLMNELNG